jgi:curli biogenesis system outer membrane secretion channel CsgG
MSPNRILWKIGIAALFLCVLPTYFPDRADAADGEKIRVGIVGFQSKADGVSDRQAEIITDLFTRELANSKSISVYEREQLARVGEEVRLSLSGLVDMNTAVEVGKLAGVQYILTGAVTELSEKTSGGGGFVPIPKIPVLGGVGVGGGAHRATAGLDIRVIDTTTGEVALALSETGTAVNTASAVAISGFAVAEAEFGGLEARAIADAVTRLSNAIRNILGDESSRVIKVSGKDFTIDVGSTMGAKTGALYLVYADGEEIRGMEGEFLGQEKIPLAVLKVAAVSSNFSVCALAPGSSGRLVQRGDRIEPVSAASLKGLKFASSRPTASRRSGTYRQLFGE